MLKPPEITQHSGVKGGLQSSWLTRGGSGDLAMFVHCSLGTARAWKKAFAQLPECAVIAPDMPDHGGTIGDPARDIIAQSVAQLVDLLDGDPGHLVGHSFGAVVALGLARDHPKLVKSLTLYEPVLFGVLDDAGHVAAAGEHAWQADMCAAFEKSSEAAAKCFMDRWGGDGGWDAIPPRVKPEIIARIGFVARVDFLLIGPPEGRISTSDLAQISCPVTLISGEKTVPVIADILDVMGQFMPQSTRKTLAGADHMGAITHSAGIIDSLRAMLE